MSTRDLLGSRVRVMERKGNREESTQIERNKVMSKRGTFSIKKKDRDLYNHLRSYKEIWSLSAFISDMFKYHGQEWIDGKYEILKLQMKKED